MSHVREIARMSLKLMEAVKVMVMIIQWDCQGSDDHGAGSQGGGGDGSCRE